MLMPLLEHLRRAYPSARIDCAVENSMASFYRLFPGMDNVYALKLGAVVPANIALSVQRVLRVVICYLQEMRHCTPDICIIPRWPDDLFRDRVLSYLIGAPRRIGFVSLAFPTAEPATYRDAFLTETYNGESGLHEPKRFSLLLTKSGLLPEKSIEDVSTNCVESLRQIAFSVDWHALADRVKIDRYRQFAILAPGASIAYRRWPIEYWGRLIESLKKSGMNIILLSGRGDADIAESLHSLTGKSTILVAGVTTFVESIALISHASLFLGNDSGPAHIAGALGLPTLTLFVANKDGNPDYPSSPTRIHPIGPLVELCMPSELIKPCIDNCSALDAHCIKNISVENVLERLDVLLERANTIHFSPK
ncbi:MAG TPA: glycosyltransferase family 9 protein [Edaphobacter sp.]|jgi:ADP-heptose:LPS heptosyltransferase|nr:glycosyltransferase family 9 protein [Edaphobacter sp.]